MTQPIPPAIESALSALWKIPSPGPSNLFKAPAFVLLRDACQDAYPDTGWEQSLNVALLHALRSLGLPCLLASTGHNPFQSVAEAAQALDRAFYSETASWTYLCPLDLASELPPLQFGPATVGRFNTEELGKLFNWPQLQRYYPSGLPSLDELAQFQWLIVREDVPAAKSPGARALPELEAFPPDPARIDPHTTRLPAAVERSLFLILLAPWEEWADMPEIDWRAFTIPWVYSRCDDLFVQPPLPRSARSLSWTTQFGIDRYGEEVEREVPVELPLQDEAVHVADMLAASAWAELQQAVQSPLFETPVAHFLVRAFLADGIDEFLAHITAIEAALGTVGDYPPRSAPHKDKAATARMVARVSALLESKDDGEMYRRLFDQRSTFLHGRPLQPISVEDRLCARRLARRIVCELVRTALRLPAITSRDDFLGMLLDQGVPYLEPR